MTAPMRITWPAQDDEPLYAMEGSPVTHIRPIEPPPRPANTPLPVENRRGLDKDEYCEALAEYALKLIRESRHNKHRVQAIQSRIQAIRGSNDPIEIVDP